MGELGQAWGGLYDGVLAFPRQDTQPGNPDWVEYPFGEFDVLEWLQPAADRQTVALAASPLVVGVIVGLLYTAVLLAGPLINPVEKPKLESHDMCGFTAGGQV